MISVIVPVYNTVAYLEECLQSIADQNVDTELIIVNDGSDDGSEIICRKWAEEGRAHLIEGKREGLSAARNKGIKSAEGDYITFVDSDDKLLPGALRTMLGIAEGNPRCGIVEAQLTADETKTCQNTKETVFTAEKAIETTLYQVTGHNPSSCGKLFKRTLFKTEFFIPDKRYEDLEIFPRLFRQAENIVVTPYTAYYYRPNPHSFINTYTPQRKDMLWATEKVLQFVETYYPAIVPAAQSRRFSAVCNMFNLATAAHEDAMAKECFDEICELRNAIIRNPHVRIKNKIAAIRSVGGFGLMKTVSQILR